MKNDKDKENYIAYVLGRIETKVEGYAESSSIPFSELSRIVGEFLCSKAGGQVLRGIHSMPSLSVERRRVGRPRKEGRPAMAEMAVPGHAHRGLSQTKKVKPHWTQTPKGRKFMAERAKTLWKKGVFKGRPQK